ncbi:MAG: c-type cytochrome domain-containing protein [Planctomycetaceae bacterium]
MRYTLSLILVCSFSSSLLADDGKPADPKEEKVTYQDHVLPLLRMRCGSCHNANDKKGGLVVDQYAALMEGGSSGSSVEPGDANLSYLFSLVTHESEPKMPPNADRLPDNEIALLRKWIDLGALENAGSKANIKPKSTIAKIMVSTERPAEVAFPAKFLGDPVVRTTQLNAVTALTVSPWAPLAAVSGHHQIAIYNTTSLQLMGVLPFPEGQPHILKFSRNGDLLMAGGGRGGASGKVVVFDVRTGERKIEVGAEYDAVLGADISPDQTMIALGGPKKMLRVYSTATGELLYEQKKHTDWITAVEFSPDGVLLASGDRANGLVVWEAETGRQFYDLQGHQGAITDVSWRPDSNVLASSSMDSNVSLWEMQNGSRIKNWGAHGGGAEAVDYTRDGNLVTTGRDNVTRLWNGDGGKIRDFGGMAQFGLEVAYDAETKRVLAGDLSGFVTVWNGDDGQVVGKIDTNPPTIAMLMDSAAKTAAEAEAAAQQKAAAVAAQQKQMADLEAKAKQVADAAAKALAAAQASTTAKNTAQQVATTTEGQVTAATNALKQAEAVLAQAKAAFDKANAENEAKKKALADAQKTLADAVAAEQAAVAAANAAKVEADKAAAAAKPTDEQVKAMQAAQAEANAARAAADQAKAALEALKTSAGG